MRRVFALSLLFMPSLVSAQIPVIDAASLAQVASTVAALHEQISVMMEELHLTRELEQHAQDIHRVTGNHYDRYKQSLSKRGVVPSASLQGILHDVEGALQRSEKGAISYVDPDMSDLWLGYTRADDPFAYERMVTEQQLGTMEGAMLSLAAHRRQFAASHRELENFKREIDTNLEPQQMRDVQASLQVLGAREMILTRQALMTLANMEAVRAAGEVNKEAQERVLYNTFVGSTDWLGKPSQYRFNRFLRMPGN